MDTYTLKYDSKMFSVLDLLTLRSHSDHAYFMAGYE